MPFGAAGLSTSRTAVSRFTAVLSEEANCAGGLWSRDSSQATRSPDTCTHKSSSYKTQLTFFINFKETLML